jgi:hypothetical protein
MDDNAHRSLARRVLISVSAMLAASVLFVGTVMLLLSVVVERVVAPPAGPAVHESADVAPTPTSGAPKAASTAHHAKDQTGGRS